MQLFLSLFILSCALDIQAQLHQISGHITDSRTGKSLSHASVSLFDKGRITGTVSNEEGNFVLSFSQFDSIQVSIVGYSNRSFYPKDPVADHLLQIIGSRVEFPTLGRAMVLLAR